MRATPSCPHPTPNTIPLGARDSTYEIWGYTNIQSITCVFLIFFNSTVCKDIMLSFLTLLLQPSFVILTLTSLTLILSSDSKVYILLRSPNWTIQDLKRVSWQDLILAKNTADFSLANNVLPALQTMSGDISMENVVIVTWLLFLLFQFMACYSS